MKKLKLFLFTLVAFFVVGFAVNVNALEVTEDLTLDTDVNEAIVVPAGKTVTLNLGGKTVTAPSGEVAITNNGTLIIEGEGNVIANGNYAVLNHGAKLTIDGGTYSKTTPSASQSLISNGWYVNSENTSGAISEMIINNGSFDGGSFTVIKNDAYGKMTINNGTFTSTHSSAGVQEAGNSITINGGTFDAVVYVMNWSSFDGEEKTAVINGGTFNKNVNIAADNSTGVAKANKVSVSIGENPVFNASLSISNSSAPAGTNPFVIEKFDVKSVMGTLTFGARSADYKMPAVNLDGMTIGGGLTLSSIEHSTIKNTTVGGDIKAGNITLVNVTAKSLATNGQSIVQNIKDSKIVWVKEGANHPAELNVTNSILGKIAPSTNGNTTMYFDTINLDGVTIISDGEALNTDPKNYSLATGELIVNGGNVTIKDSSIEKISVPKKPKENVNIAVSEGSIVNSIVNNRTDDSPTTATINIPDSYLVDEEGNVTISLNENNVSGIKSSYVYAEEAIVPDLVVKYGNNVLKEGTDYTVTITDNNAPGTANVKIEGQGIYKGIVEKTFKITIDLSSAKVTGIKTQTYNGKQQRQTGLVVDLYGTTLIKDVDYTVSYSSLINAGKVTMTIKGIGGFEGKIVKTFTRNKAKNPLSFKYYNKTVYYSKVRSSAQVVKPIYVSKKVGTLTYTKMSGSSAKLLLNKTTGKVTVKKGTAKGKYKIRIKVAASGNVNYYSNYAIRTIYVTVK